MEKVDKAERQNKKPPIDDLPYKYRTPDQMHEHHEIVTLTNDEPCVCVCVCVFD